MTNRELFIDRLSALGQQSRLKIVELLLQAGEGGISAGELAARAGIPRPTVSIHLGILLRAGLVRSARQKQSIFYSAEKSSIQDAIDELEGLLVIGGPSSRIRTAANAT